MITNPAVESPSPSPKLDKSDLPYSHSDPFVTTPSDIHWHQQQQEHSQSQINEMESHSPKEEAVPCPITNNEDSAQEQANYQGGGYYNDSYNYSQHGYPSHGYPQQGSQTWPQQHQGPPVEYYHQHHQGGGYPHNYYNHHQHSSNYPTSDPYHQQQQMHPSQYYQHPHGHHHLHPHQSNGSSGGGGGSNNCTPSPHAGSDDSSGDAVNEAKPPPHHFQQQYPQGKPGYVGSPYEMYGHPNHTNIGDPSCIPTPAGMLVHNTNNGYIVKPEMGSQPITTSVLKRPRSSLLPAAKRSKKSSRHRDPNEPQKPVSAYALFFRDTQAQIKSRSPAATFGEVSKMVAALWDGLDPDSKAAYKRRTETAKKEYLKRLASYRASLISQGDQTGGTINPYNIGGGSSGFAYPTPRAAGVILPNPGSGESDSLERTSKVGLPMNYEGSLRSNNTMPSSTEPSVGGDRPTPPASASLSGGPGPQYSSLHPQSYPSANTSQNQIQHSSLKPISSATHLPQPNNYGAHHQIGSPMPTGSSISNLQPSSQPVHMSGSSFPTSDLHQSTQSNQLGSGHVSRGNYQQQGRVA